MSERKVVLYISMSLDGYLATEADDLSWLSVAEREGEDYGYAAFNETVDAYVVGRKTYEKVLSLTGGSFPAAEQHECYVITQSERKAEKGVTFYNKGIARLIAELKQKPGKDIYCDGGATVVKMLMEKDLIDEYRIAVIPILLGNGKRLFKGGTPGISIELVASKTYDSGVVTLHYKRK